MSKSDAFEADILKLIFNATAIANIADNAGSSPLTNLYVSLHTADPGETGNQGTSEVSYTGYARVPVARTTSGWNVSGTTSCSPVASIDFGACTAIASAIDASYMGIGVAVSGATKLLYSGPISPTIHIDVGVTPQLSTGTVITED